MNAGRKMMILSNRENKEVAPRMGGYNEGVEHHPYVTHATYENGYKHHTYEDDAKMEFEYPEGRRYKNGRFAPARAEMEHDDSHQKMQIGFASGGEDEVMPFSQMTAEKWTRGMENEDGSKGAHWSMDQVKNLMAQRGISGDPWEFYTALNVVYSDYSKVLKKHGVGDKLDFYVDLAKAFMDDKDAQPDKMARYYRYIVKH